MILFFNSSKGMSKVTKIAMCIMLLALVIVSSIFYRNMSILNINKRIDFITSKYLLSMEVDGYLSDENENKIIKELESIGVSNISLDETTKKKTENKTVILKVKAIYKDKEIKREKISRFI